MFEKDLLNPWIVCYLNNRAQTALRQARGLGVELKEVLTLGVVQMPGAAEKLETEETPLSQNQLCHSWDVLRGGRSWLRDGSSTQRELDPSSNPGPATSSLRLGASHLVSLSLSFLISETHMLTPPSQGCRRV